MSILTIQIIAIVVVTIIVGGAFFWADRKKKTRAVWLAERRAFLMSKYNDEDVVNDIMNQRVFTGETAEMLVDSLGDPASKDQKILKTKTRETWKYHQTGHNQYRTRITLENNIVTGWDIKDAKR